MGRGEGEWDGSPPYHSLSHHTGNVYIITSYLFVDENGDPETGSTTALVDKGPPTSVIIPIYRRDCHEEVYAGSHTYPGKGVYLLKFDNTYSLWRSKTLYYRVYYTK